MSAIRGPNALRESDYFQLHKYGGPKFNSVSASCAAALFLTALATVTSWPKWISQLEACAKECLPIELSAGGIITPTYWDSEPLALNLKHAYNGFPNCPKLAGGGAFLINELLAQELASFRNGSHTRFNVSAARHKAGSGHTHGGAHRKAHGHAGATDGKS